MASVGPSGELKIKQKVDALLRSPAQSEDDLDELDEAICEWDRRIVEFVIDSPAVLSGYKVGKALSLTRWKIWAARRWSRAGWAPSLDPWEEVFCKKRVDEIQRHLNALSNFLDPRAVTAVSTGLGYWRNALLSFTSAEGPTSVRSPSWWRNTLLRLASIGEPSSSRSVSSRASSQEHVIKIPAEQSEKLLMALEEQSRIWLDLLTGRRPPDSFPTAGIVTALTKKMAANLWSRLFRFLMPVVAGIAVLVVVVALVWAGYLAYRAGNSGAGSGLFGSLGTAVGGVITFLAVQGQALLGRGAANGAWGRPGNGGTRNNGAFLLRSNHGIGAAAGVLADLQRDVLSGVVEQIRLEELNLAVSEPLMRCVLALNNRESQKGDPLKDAERFLRLIYKEESNLDRLRPVFKDLYKH